MCQKTLPETNRTKAPQNQPSSKMLSFKSSLGAQKADFFQGVLAVKVSGKLKMIETI